MYDLINNRKRIARLPIDAQCEIDIYNNGDIKPVSKEAYDHLNLNLSRMALEPLVLDHHPGNVVAMHKHYLATGAVCYLHNSDPEVDDETLAWAGLFDTNTGELVWGRDIGYGYTTAIKIHGNDLYVTGVSESAHGEPVGDNRIVVAKFDLMTGRLVWRNEQAVSAIPHPTDIVIKRESQADEYVVIVYVDVTDPFRNSRDRVKCTTDPEGGTIHTEQIS